MKFASILILIAIVIIVVHCDGGLSPEDIEEVQAGLAQRGVKTTFINATHVFGIFKNGTKFEQVFSEASGLKNRGFVSTTNDQNVHELI